MEENTIKGHVLLVDDEPAILEALGELLEAFGYSITTADCYDNAVKVLESDDKIETVICDLKMPGKSGLEVLRYINQNALGIPLLFLTGFGTLESCQQAMDEGSFGYILKPLDNKDKVVIPLQHAVERRRLEIKNKTMQQDILKMAQEHQAILDNLLSDVEIKDKIQEQINTILEKWDDKNPE